MRNMEYITASKLAEYRTKNCPSVCPILGYENTKPVVDHDHKSGKIRGVISSDGNALIGKIENFFFSRCSRAIFPLPEVLRQIANYLEREQGPLHPVGIRQLVRRFKNKSLDDQIMILNAYGLGDDIISKCKNSVERAKIYRELLIKE